jgi:hypothetical protein
MTSIRRVWQAEGTLAVRDRLWDRLRDARRRATGWPGRGGPWPETAIVNVIGVPLTTQYGGVPLQLRARLTHEAACRAIALVSRDADGSLRLDAWDEGHTHHRVTRFPRGAWNGDPLAEDQQWLDTVRTCCQLVQARAVHVENAAGLSLVSLARLADPDDGLPVVLSVHDFSLFCCGKRAAGSAATRRRRHAAAPASTPPATVSPSPRRRIANSARQCWRARR